MKPSTYPLISCICISQGKPGVLKKSISQFLTQTYPNKELIVVYQKGNSQKKKIIESYKNLLVSGYKLNINIDLMFEYALNKTNGDPICIWNETDWHHVARIEYQYQALLLKRTPSCLLNYVVLFNTKEKKSYISAKKLWIGTLLCTKAFLKEEKFSNLPILLNEEFDNVEKVYIINDVPNLHIHKVLNDISEEDREEVLRHSYELNARDCKFIYALLKTSTATEKQSLELDALLENPLFDTQIEYTDDTQKIPKIIHVTYKNKTVPDNYLKTFESIKRFHPDWEIRFYDDHEVELLIKQNFPELLELYNSYPLNIQRVDLFRALVVYLSGGFYLDLDMHCFKRLDELCGLDLVLAEEIVYTKAKDKRVNFNGNRQIGNYMFGSKPKHPFWIALIKEMVKRCDTIIELESHVLESTGPGVLSDVFLEKELLYKNVRVIKNKFKRCHSGCPAVCCHFGDFAAHLHVNSWTWTNKNINKPIEGFISTITERDKKELRRLLDSRLEED